MALTKKERNKRWNEKHKEKRKELNKLYREANNEKVKELQKEWRETHSEYIVEQRNTPIGRARMLYHSYNKSDKLKNRGKGDLTPEWIVENIFSKPCAHCGETDWHKIGCNRLDNSRPHTKDNVEPCCWDCNRELWYNKK